MAEQEEIKLETVTLTAEDGTTHIYTMGSDGVVAGLPSQEQAPDQNVMIENDGNVFYFVQSEGDAVPGVSYVVIDEAGNESSLIGMEGGEVQHTDLTNVEILQTIPEPAAASVETQTGNTLQLQVIVEGGNTAEATGSDLNKPEALNNSDSKDDIRNAERRSEGRNDEPQPDASEEYEDENVKYILYCQCCGEASDTLEELKDHLLEFHGISDVTDPEDNSLEDISEFSTCNQCGAMFLTENDLDDHKTSEHTGQENLKPPENKIQISYGHKCQFCVQTFDVRSDLDSHVELEHDWFDGFVGDENWYGKCPYCPRLYLARWTSKSLKRHIRVDHPGKDVNAQIEMIEVKDKNNLRKLKSVMKNPGVDSFPCYYCTKVFHWHKSLSRHIKMFHENKLENLNARERREILGRERRRNTFDEEDNSLPAYPCPCCSKEFMWLKSLKRHVLELHGNTLEHFDDKLVEPTKKKRKQVHSGTDYFKCLYCSLISKYAHSIRNHMVRKHPEVEGINVKEIELPTVDASEGISKAKANDTRSREERLSECTVVFKCPKCSYATNNPSNLQRHLTSRVHRADLDKKDIEEKKMNDFKVKQTSSRSTPTSPSAFETSATETSKQGSEEEMMDQIDEQAEMNDDVTLETDKQIETDGHIEIDKQIETDGHIETDEQIKTDDKAPQLYKFADIPELCKTSNNFKVTFQCPECSEHSFLFEKLEEHYKAEHPGIPFHVTKDEVLVVKQVKKAVRPLKAMECPYCDLILSQVHVLQKHVTLNHRSCVNSIDIKQEPADAENEAHDAYKDDGTMVESCKKSIVTAYRCLTCICVFPNIVDLVRHMSIIHPGLNKSVSKSPKKRGRKRKVQEAEITIDPQEAKKASFDSTASVSQYENQCPHCSFSCKRASALTFHINFNHAKIKTEPETEETPRKKAQKDPAKTKTSNSAVKPKQQSSKAKKMDEELPVTELDAEDDFVQLDQPTRRFKCSHCTTGAFTSARMLEKHVKRLHPEESKSFSSADTQPVESEAIADIAVAEDDFGALDDDLDVDYQPDEDEFTDRAVKYSRRFKCPYCSSGAFISGRMLERHVKKLHPGEAETFSLEDLKRGESEATTVGASIEDNGKHTCAYCKKSFCTELEVHNHMKTEHKFAKSITDVHQGILSDHEATGEDVSVNVPTVPVVSETGPEIKVEDEDYNMDLEEELQLSARTATPIGIVKCESGSMSFKCKYCNKFFLSKNSVMKHASSVHPRKQKLEEEDIEAIFNETDKAIENCFKCPYCDKTSTWKKCIVRHVKKQHPEVANFDPDDIQVEIGMARGVWRLPEVSQYQCPYCQSIHKWKKSIVRHIRTNHRHENQDVNLRAICLDPNVNSSYKEGTKKKTHLRRLVHCPLCDFKCRARRKMERHFNKSHPKEADSVTYSSFQYSYEQKQDKQEKGDPDSPSGEVFTCHVCQTTYGWKKSLIYHMKIHHPNEADVFDTLWNLVQLVERAHGNPVIKKKRQRISCGKCGTTFRTKCARQQHEHWDHRTQARFTIPMGRRRAFRCVQCRLGFHTRRALAIHRACHHLRRWAVSCDLCGQQCSSIQTLAVHRQRCQEGRVLVCPEIGCNFSCGLKSSLTKHGLDHPPPPQSTEWFHEPSSAEDKCEVCNKVFERRGQLRKHLVTDHLKKNWHLVGIDRKRKCYACKECSASFSLPSLRDKHIAEVHKDITEMCEICGSIFPTLASLRKHYAKHEADDEDLLTKGSCNLCGAQMQKKNLNKHYLYKHPEAVVCQCKICTSQSATGSSVKECDICSMVFCRKMLLEAHKRFVHQLSGNNRYSKYRCKYCAQLFTTNRQRYIHLHKHHNQPATTDTVVEDNLQEVEVKGDITGGEDKETATTSTHVIHIGEGQGIQYLPKLSEASLSAVIKELMIVSTEKNCKLPYKCLLCGRCFAKTKYIRLHIRRYHVKDEDQPYRCKICGSGFVRLTEFRKHSRAHSGFRPYKCKTCGKAFKQQANLTDHMNIHNATRQFQCFICKRYFRQRGALNAHIVHHDLLKPFTCTFCDKGFSTRGELSRHMQHYDLGQEKSKGSGARSFMCHICQESFSHFPLLLKHIEEHHPERPFECQVCGHKFAAFISMYNHKLKSDHFLVNEIETEGEGEGVRKVKRKKISTRDVQEAVYSIEEANPDVDEGLQDVNESMLIIQSGELYEVPTSGYQPIEPRTTLVIDQFQREEVVHGTHVENEELLSIAKQLTELSTYTEAEVAEADTAAALQEEDEIMKDMLDADHDLLANIGKQLTVARKEDEWNTDSTMEAFTTSEDMTNTGRVEISQGVDLTVSVGESESGVMAVPSTSSQVVSEASSMKTVPSNMEELASLITQNSKAPGEPVTAYQTDDGSVIYVVEDLAATNNYIVAGDPAEGLKSDFESQDGVGEEMVLECETVGMPEASVVTADEASVVTADDEDTVDNVEGVDNQESGQMTGQIEADTELVQPVICEAQQLEKFTVSDSQAFTSDSQVFTVPQKVVEYMHDEQTFIKEELIDGDYVLKVSTIGNPEASSAEVEYNTNIYKCSKCNYTSTSRKNIDKHLPRHMPEASRQHPCQVCSKRFVTNSELSRHMTIHTGERKYKCTYCSKSFKQPGHLRSHVKSHLGQKEYMCSECPNKFVTMTQCKSHYQRLHSKERFPCDECGKTFGDKMGLKRHQGSVHSEAFRSDREEPEGAFQCHVCGHSFAKNSNLKYHMLKHVSESDRPKFICETCGDTFKTRHLLNSHVAVQHMDQKPQICEYCGLAFKLKKQLSSHIRFNHNEGVLKKKSAVVRRVYTCSCGKKFQSRHSMAYHIGASEACKNAKITVEKADDKTNIKEEEPNIKEEEPNIIDENITLIIQ